MKATLVTLILSLVFFLNQSHAQQKNPFFQKEFWQTNPSKEDIDKKIKEGFSIHDADPYGFDPTTYAIFGDNSIETIDYLVQKGNSVNKKTHDFRTYIFWAAYRGNLPLMKYFKDKGAKMDLRDSHGFTLLLFAAVTGQQNQKLYDFCIANGADITKETDHHGSNALHLIIPRLKDLTMVDYFINKGLAINSIDHDGNGIFNFAVRSGNKELLDQLIKRGVSYKENTKVGGNAFLFVDATQENTLSLLTYLEELGIQPNITTAKGITPLHKIANATDTKVFEFFLNKGVDINKQDEQGNTALFNAAGRNTLAAVKFLAEKSNAVTTVNKKGETALTRAIRTNTDEVVAYLISKGADVHLKDKNGNNLAFHLIQSFNGKGKAFFDKKIAALQKGGLSIAEKQKDGRTLLHLAVDKNDLELVKKVSDFKIDVNAKDANGNTALHYAAMKSKNDKILKFLISLGADTNIKTDFDETVFDLAIDNEFLKKEKVDLQFLK